MILLSGNLDAQFTYSMTYLKPGKYHYMYLSIHLFMRAAKSPIITPTALQYSPTPSHLPVPRPVPAAPVVIRRSRYWYYILPPPSPSVLSPFSLPSIPNSFVPLPNHIETATVKTKDGYLVTEIRANVKWNE
jgi:hypothetical protein